MSGITFETGNLEELRVKVGTWANRNFGHTWPSENTQAWHLAQLAGGMAEELSELIESGYGLTTTPTDHEEYLDAIADICIWALDFCFTAGFGMQDMLLLDKEMNRWEKEFLRDPQRPSVPILHEGLCVLIGKICHDAIKLTQQIRRTEDHFGEMKLNMCHVWRICYRLSTWAGMDLNELVHKTASNVLRRDWKTNPDTAHEVDNADRE